MKPAVILYKKLPDDLRARLAAHAEVTEISDLSPASQQQHAAALAQCAHFGFGMKILYNARREHQGSAVTVWR